MNKHAILIAVEEYSDPAIESVRFAQNDAEALCEALKLHGCDDPLVLINEQATKATIESKVKQVTKRLTAGDVLYFFYAGRGFSQAGQNYITCHDTLSNDSEDTSVALGPIFQELHDSPCERVALFLDASESGSLAGSEANGYVDNLKPKEVETILSRAAHCACFASCRDDEQSYSSRELKQGIWTHHLVEALQGHVPRLLTDGHLLASDLQNYLSDEVPRTLRKTLTSGVTQTPWLLGGASGDLSLADLEPVLAARRAAAEGEDGAMARGARFLSQESKGIKTLSGWQKSHRVPDRVNETSELFVSKISAEELKDDFERIRIELKNAFGYARRDFDGSGYGDGSGTIITPDFTYSINIALDDDNPAKVIWTRTVDSIVMPEQITSDAFADVFDGVFTTLELTLPNPLNVTDFIDEIEAQDNPQVQLDYDFDCEFCDLRIEGTAGKIRVTPKGLSIVHDFGDTVEQLIESFKAVQALFVENDLPLLTGK